MWAGPAGKHEAVWTMASIDARTELRSVKNRIVGNPEAKDSIPQPELARFVL